MNPFKALINMIPLGKVDVGTVTATDEGGVTVTLQMGGVVHVRGEAAIGTRVYIKNGAVEGPAPNLTGVDIEV